MNYIEIFIITYNRKTYFKEALDSIRNQNINNLKITIIENGSDEFNKLDQSVLDNINFIKLEQNKPIYQITDLIKNLITHEYLIVFHDDDLMHPSYINICNKILKESDYKINLIATKFDSFIDNDKIDFIQFNDSFKKTICSKDSDLAALLYKGEYLHYGSVVYKSEIFKNTSLKFEEYGKICDRPFILECALGGQLVYIDAPLIKYRVHQNQDSSSVINGPYINQLVNLEKLYFTLLSKSFFSRNNLIFLKHCFRYLRNNYIFLRKNNLYTGTFLEFIKHCIRAKSINKISIILGGLYFFYLSKFRKIIS